MKNELDRLIAVEFRALLDQDSYIKMLKTMNDVGEDLGLNDKETFFFIMKEKLLKVSRNIPDKSTTIALKSHKMTESPYYIEKTVTADETEFSKIVEIFKELKISSNIMYSMQKRHDFIYKNVLVSLKHSETWGYHVEYRVDVRDSAHKENAINKIYKVSNELGTKIMTPEELMNFTSRREDEND